jgi:methylase of polypeptide subunit release factors
VAGPTGVEVVERLVEAAESRLTKGGWLLVEIGPTTAAAAEGIIARRPGLVPGPTLADMAGLPRIVQARKL